MHSSASNNEPFLPPVEVLAGECLSSLDNSETSPHPLDHQSAAQHRIHASHWEDRARIVRAFHDSPLPALQRRAEKLALCCVSPVVRFDVGRRPTLTPGRCRDRLCPLCQRIRAAEVRARLQALVQRADQVRFVTFTLPASTDQLGARIDLLLSTFTALRRRAFWRERVQGGAFVVEVTRGARGEHWHAHLHVLVEGTYMAQAALQDEWSNVLGTLGIVDIRAVHKRAASVRYMADYLGKGWKSADWTDEQLCDFAVGIARRRLVGTFGTWHKIDVNADADAEPDHGIPRHGITWGLVRTALESGTIDAAHWCPLLWTLGHTWRLLLRPHFDPPTEIMPMPSADSFAPLVSALAQVEGVDLSPRITPTPPDANAQQARLFTQRTL